MDSFPSLPSLPRFRLPDESSARDVNAAAASGGWAALGDLDHVGAQVAPSEEEFDGMPTLVRRGFLKGASKAATKSANVDDVVEELRAAAAGRAPRVRELASKELVDEGAGTSGPVMEVKSGEIFVDRVAGSAARRDGPNVGVAGSAARRDGANVEVVPARPVWNVHQARPSAPSLVGPTRAPSARFVFTAALAMLGGALLAMAAAYLVWRLSGLSL